VTESDEDDLDYLIRLVRGLGFRLFVRDNSYLGFPAYTAYIPGASEVDFLFDAPRFDELAAWTRFAREHETLLNLPDADDAARKRLAGALKEAEDSCLTDKFLPKKWFLSHEELPPFARDRRAFAAVLYGCAGMYADAVSRMDEFLDSDAALGAPRRLCMAMRDGWLAHSEGGSPEAALTRLSEKYGEALAEKAWGWRFREEEWPTCFDCERCGMQKACRFEALCRRQRRAQEQMALSAIDQAALEALFEKHP
jgi:ribosomal protein S12 methylthiotransferase accessory factor